MASDIRTRSRIAVATSQTERRRRLSDINRPRTERDGQLVALREYIDKQQLLDPFKSEYGDVSANTEFQILEPAYSFYALMRLPDENSMLKQCIAAMATNVDGHGHRLEYIGPEGAEDSPAAQAEKVSMEELLDFPNDDYSFQTLRDRLRWDMETLGNAYIEIGRDAKGKVVMLSHVPAHTVRLTSRDPGTTEVKVNLPRDGKQTTTIRKRFRRYVQIVGTRKVYFKEFGDPRRIDPTTGRENPNLRITQSATELHHFTLYTPGSPYGLPRWFNQLPSIMGSRQAELTNLDFFKENAIPAMLLMVSGGLLTDESLEAIETHFTQARGRGAMNRVAVIEVGGDPSNAPESGAMPVPKVELKPLTAERQGDALFQQYEGNCSDKIRSAFRLPPLYVGLAQDLTYATAKTSFEVAESQVFTPERQKFDDFVNTRLLSTFRPKFWSFRSLPPRLASREDVIAALGVFERIGALTPNVTIQLANEFFDLQIRPVGEAWGDYPFSLVTTMVQTGQLSGDAFTGLASVMKDISSGRPGESGSFADPAADPAADPNGDPTVDPNASDPERVRDALLALRRKLVSG